LNTGANIAGRALARNGAVTLDTNAISFATCGASPPPVPTLAQWAMIAMTLLLGFAGYTAMMRRQTA